jgi:hypothetical protein
MTIKISSNKFLTWQTDLIGVDVNNFYKHEACDCGFGLLLKRAFCCDQSYGHKKPMFKVSSAKMMLSMSRWLMTMVLLTNLLVYGQDSALAAAAEDTPEQQDSAKNQIAEQPRSSWDNRSGKKFSILGVTAGLSQFATGTGVTFSWFISRNTQLEAGYFEEEWNKIHYENSITRTSKFSTLRLKHFVRNSFYFTGGGGTRELYYEHNVPSSSSEAPIPRASYRFVQKETQLIVDLAVGNQWQFKGFTIGCDWLGISLPRKTLSQSIQIEGTPPVDTGNGDMRYNDKALFRIINGTEWWLTRAYIGWSF